MWVQSKFQVRTRGRSFTEVTAEVARIVRDAGITVGLCHLFLRHTSASLCITENADPDVRTDLEHFAQTLTRRSDLPFRHTTEGSDDMPAHIRNLLAGYELTVPIGDGHLGLGTWQGIYLWEHRDDGHVREIVVTLQGEKRAA
jgi:secondary thiamine-phosphate synthase enzyme